MEAGERDPTDFHVYSRLRKILKSTVDVVFPLIRGLGHFSFTSPVVPPFPQPVSFMPAVPPPTVYNHYNSGTSSPTVFSSSDGNFKRGLPDFSLIIAVQPCVYIVKACSALIEKAINKKINTLTKLLKS